MKGHNFGLCKKCGKIHYHPRSKEYLEEKVKNLRIKAKKYWEGKEDVPPEGELEWLLVPWMVSMSRMANAEVISRQNCRSIKRASELLRENKWLQDLLGIWPKEEGVR